MLYVYKEIKNYPTTIHDGKIVYKCKGQIQHYDTNFYKAWFSQDGSKVVLTENYEGDKIIK